MNDWPILKQLADVMQFLLTQIHEGLSFTWGWSIIVLTIVVRLALVPLTVKQQQSMRQMQALQPEIKAIQQKHAGDRAAVQAATMEFYRERKVNPFGSCLPMLAQVPIFLSLYLALRDESHYRDGTPLSFLSADFIPDITMHLSALGDEGLTTTLAVLMVIYVGSQMLSTLLVPSTVDKAQKYIFLFMPLIFAIFILKSPTAIPVGLMVYWITSNLWTVGQGAVIRRFFPPPIVAQRKAEEEARELAREKKEERKAEERRRKSEAVPKPVEAARKAEQKRQVRRPQKPPRPKQGPSDRGGGGGPKRPGGGS